MKTLKLFVFGLLFISASQAQVAVNVNLGTPPVWAPAERVATQYYYLPEIDSYYDVPAQRFIYPNNGKWVKAKKLPKYYSNYNLKGGKIVYLTDYRGNAPYKYHKNHKAKYYVKRGGPNNVIYVQDHNYKKNKNYKNQNKHFKNQDQKKNNNTDKYFKNQDQKKKNGTDKYFNKN